MDILNNSLFTKNSHLKRRQTTTSLGQLKTVEQ